ncbi:ORF123 [Ranid herpesvirus 1]|uniref:ORF123 n=1 Tax=Ranid herpesvirus 1 TaxID=85655 RepID=Q14VK7_9VIRU|nr:ORF123 [Ranid herpesvirus 1]ABG25755.1 ORF123 [Ranid herpesvirus 1]
MDAEGGLQILRYNSRWEWRGKELWMALRQGLQSQQQCDYEMRGRSAVGLIYNWVARCVASLHVLALRFQNRTEVATPRLFDQTFVHEVLKPDTLRLMAQTYRNRQNPVLYTRVPLPETLADAEGLCEYVPHGALFLQYSCTVEEALCCLAAQGLCKYILGENRAAQPAPTAGAEPLASALARYRARPSQRHAQRGPDGNHPSRAHALLFLYYAYQAAGGTEDLGPPHSIATHISLPVPRHYSCAAGTMEVALGLSEPAQLMEFVGWMKTAADSTCDHIYNTDGSEDAAVVLWPDQVQDQRQDGFLLPVQKSWGGVEMLQEGNVGQAGRFHDS